MAAWADGTEAAELFLSVVSLQDLAIGALLKERSDPAQGAVLQVPDRRPVRDGLSPSQRWCTG